MTSISDNVLSLDVLSCLSLICVSEKHGVKHMWQWHHNLFISLPVPVCACIYAKKRKEGRKKSLMINLLLLKQSKCKLDFSICMFQDVMRFEFKLTCLRFIHFESQVKFKEKRLQHKQTENYGCNITPKNYSWVARQSSDMIMPFEIGCGLYVSYISVFLNTTIPLFLQRSSLLGPNAW